MTDPNEDLLDEFFLARIAAFQDGSLSEAELEQFNRELLEDAAKRRALVECQLQSARIRSVLVQESELARAAQNDPRQHDTIQYDSTESDSIVHESCDASRSRRRTFRRLGAVCATAACIVLGIFLSLRENSDAPDSKLVDAVLSYERSATWEESSRSPVVGDRLAARGYDLRAGRIRVEFAHGTIVTVRGPARFRFVDDTEMRLEYGKISVKIGRKDGQFSVLTESMEVLDLGTAFGMDVQRDGSATVSVFDGRVSAKTKSEAGERVLEEGMSASAEPGEALLSVPFDAERYSDLWPLTNGIDELTGRVRFLPPGPDMALESFSSNNELFMLPEKQGVRLQAPLIVDGAEPGTFDRFGKNVEAIIPSGTVVSSFLLYFHHAERREKAVYHELKGTITFARSIVGVIGGSQKLKAADSVVGLPSIRYAEHDRWRGLGRNEDKRTPEDVLEVSADRRTLRFRLHSGRAMDQFRVLVEAE